jgi:multiple sugar transport system substrate-binding protein
MGTLRNQTELLKTQAQAGNRGKQVTPRHGLPVRRLDRPEASSSLGVSYPLGDLVSRGCSPVTRRVVTLRMAAVAAATASGAGALTACLGADSRRTPAGPVGGTSKSVSGSVSWFVRTNQVENDWQQNVAVPSFKREAPGVEVTTVVAGQSDAFDDKLTALWAGGTPPDIWSHSGRGGFADYRHRGMVADLTPRIRADKYDTGAFLSGLVELYTIAGKVYGLPQLTTFGTFLYCNKTAFEQAGIPLPPVRWDSTGWTWDDMTRAAERLTARYDEPGEARYGIQYNQTPWLLGWQFGGDPFLAEHYQTGLAKTTRLDSPEVIDGVQAAQDLVFRRRVQPTSQLQSQALAGLRNDLFTNGKVAMFVRPGAVWNYRTTISGFKWVLAVLPKAKTRTGITNNDPWLLSTQSKSPDAAWSFAKYLVSTEGQRAYVNATGTPATRKDLLADWVQTYQGIIDLPSDTLRSLVEGSLQHAKEGVNHMIVGWPEISKAINDNIAGVWQNTRSPKEALTAAKQAVDGVLATIR